MTSTHITHASPQLHEGTEQQGLGRVRVRCTCGLATSWQPLGTLREAVRVAAATR